MSEPTPLPTEEPIVYDDDALPFEDGPENDTDDEEPTDA
jgi:hypothetical protein